METKRLALAVKNAGFKADQIALVSPMIIDNLFKTITNANFDNSVIAASTMATKAMTVNVSGGEVPALDAKAGVLVTKDEDIRSMRELITYGLKGLAAYLKHAAVLGFKDSEIETFLIKALASLLDDSLSLNDYIELTMETGNFSVKAMALLDKANTSTYGNPEITNVNIGVRSNPGI